MDKPGLAVCALLERGGRLLLVRRAYRPFQGSWCLPGGMVEAGETAVQAVIREVKEETGLSFAPVFFRYYDEINPSLDWHHLVLAFSGQPVGNKITSDSEVLEAGWFTLEEAKGLKMAFAHMEIINDWFASKRKR